MRRLSEGFLSHNNLQRTAPTKAFRCEFAILATLHDRLLQLNVERLAYSEKGTREISRIPIADFYDMP